MTEYTSENQRTSTPMTDLVTAMILQARVNGITGNCIRMAPMDVSKMTDENKWFLECHAAKTKYGVRWTFEDGYNFLGYQVQVDLSVIPGQPTLGAVELNYQRSN